MLRILLVCAVILLNFSAACAQDKKEFKPAGKDSVYYREYGQAGLDQYNNFVKVMKNAVKPYSIKKSFYKPPGYSVADYAYDYVIPTKMPPPKNPHCISFGEMSTQRETTTEFYKIKERGRMHNIRIEIDFCGGNRYNLKKKTLSATPDCSNPYRLTLVKDGRELFHAVEAREYGIFKSDFVVKGADACAGMWTYDRYDWIKEKRVGKNGMDISTADD